MKAINNQEGFWPRIQNLAGSFDGVTINDVYYEWPYVPEELLNIRIKRIVLEDHTVHITTY